MLNQELELSLNMAFARAREHRHEFMTVELDKEKNALTYGFQSAQKHKPEAAH
ncbi:TPA: hypothetical protein ACGBOR_002936 [Salmonella enterica subsp. enterica serovar Dublin]